MNIPYFIIMILLCFIILQTVQFLTFWIMKQAFSDRLIKIVLFPGVLLHEMSHMLIAMLFGHRVISFSAFNLHAGIMGHVTHCYNPRSILQTIGNAFIAVAPLIFGITMVLVLAEISGLSIAAYTSTHLQATTVLEHISTITSWIDTLVFKNHFSSIVIAYLMLSISVTMFPSKTDFNNASAGFIILIGGLTLLYLLLSIAKIDSVAMTISGLQMVTNMLYICVIINSASLFFVGFLSILCIAFRSVFRRNTSGTAQ